MAVTAKAKGNDNNKPKSYFSGCRHVCQGLDILRQSPIKLEYVHSTKIVTIYLVNWSTTSILYLLDLVIRPNLCEFTEKEGQPSWLIHFIFSDCFSFFLPLQKLAQGQGLVSSSLIRK